jgi:hypothetical protein
LSSAWASVLIAAATLITGYSAGVWRGGRREGAAEVRLQAIAKSLEDLVHDKDRVHAEIIQQMREDRQATNERLTYLERYVWPVRGRRQGGP